MAQDNFSDRLLAAIDKKNSPLVVGLDPVYASLPEAIRSNKNFNAPSAAQAAAHGETVFARQHEVEDDEVRRVALQLLVEVARVGKRRHLKTLLGQIAGQQVAQAHVVVDDQDPNGCVTESHGELNVSMSVTGDVMCN